MNEGLEILMEFCGGLALFLYGMRMMSDSLQKAAGEKMKKILTVLTGNPLKGVLCGALVTAVLQSSSATTVMAIGFVSAGMMNLPQAIAVVFGANIGTTMTAQLIAFNLGDYLYILIFAGFMVSFLSKKENTKQIGLVILGFGILFLGIETMSTAMNPLAKSEFFIHQITKFRNVPVLGLFAGTGMTLVVQSSSSTIAILQNLARQAGPDGIHSLIGLNGAIPILLGDNIGTTITAVLASIGQSKDCKRVALAHCIFNVSGSILFLFLIDPYADLVRMISPKGPELKIISRQIANAHTGFNLIMTMIWTPLIHQMEKIVVKLIPDTKKEAQRESDLSYTGVERLG